MVYYGLKLLSPDYFYPTACLICLVIGRLDRQLLDRRRHPRIGLMGVAREMGLDPAITAGAVISGAYFGDKLSPLSGTANLACAAAGSDLYDACRASRCGPPCPRSSSRSCSSGASAPPWSSTPAGRHGAHRGRLPALADALPPAGARPRAGAHALAALRRHLPRCARGRRPRRRRRARAGRSPSPATGCRMRPRAPQGRLGHPRQAATSPRPASPPSTSC